MDIVKFSEMLEKTDRYAMLLTQKESESKAEKFEALWNKNKYAQKVYRQLLRKMKTWESFILPRLEEMAKKYWGEDVTYGYMKPDEEELKEEVYCMVTSDHQNLASMLWQVTGPSIYFGIHKKWPLFIVAAYAMVATEPEQKLRFICFYETLDSYGNTGTYDTLKDLEKALIKVFNEGPFYAHPNFDF